MQLYSAPLLMGKWLKNPDDCDKTTLETVAEIIEQWSTRLHGVSWDMRGINEVIAHIANAEEKIKDLFFEIPSCLFPPVRYKSQALLDGVAILNGLSGFKPGTCCHC